MKKNLPKILFVYEMPLDQEKFWKDGLFCALKILEKYFDITRYNLAENTPPKSPMGPPYPDSDWHTQFTLGWGGFGSQVDKWLRDHPFKKGLCVAGNALPSKGKENYSVLFGETQWILDNYIGDHSNKRQAFGVSPIFKPAKSPKIWDFTTVGAFSTWKRQEKLLEKEGNRLAVGYIQRGNLQESMDIIGNLLAGGVMVSDQVSPETLAKIYNVSENIFLPANIYGGSERAVLEARSCGVNVEISNDNPKLQELLTCPIYTAQDYANNLRKGIESVL